MRFSHPGSNELVANRFGKQEISVFFTVQMTQLFVLITKFYASKPVDMFGTPSQLSNSRLNASSIMSSPPP